LQVGWHRTVNSARGNHHRILQHPLECGCSRHTQGKHWGAVTAGSNSRTSSAGLSQGKIKNLSQGGDRIGFLSCAVVTVRRVKQVPSARMMLMP